MSPNKFVLFIIAITLALIIPIIVSLIDPIEELNSVEIFTSVEELTTENIEIEKEEFNTTEITTIEIETFITEIISTTEEVTTEEPTENKTTYTTDDEYSATIIAKIIYGEARGIYSITEQACIAWTILNRVDYYGGTIAEIALAPNQFAYGTYFPTADDYGRDLLALAKDVIGRWEAEKNGATNVGRVLPSDYMWYAGDGQHNYYRNAYQGGNRWDYSLTSPYES